VPKIARELSARAVDQRKTKGMHAVGGVPGLYLQVQPTATEHGCVPPHETIRSEMSLR